MRASGAGTSTRVPLTRVETLGQLFGQAPHSYQLAAGAGPRSGPAFGGRARSRASRAFRPQPRISRAARRDLRRRSGLGGPLAEGSRPRPLRAIRLTRIGSITGKIGRAHV